jgi:hypothetical protein
VDGAFEKLRAQVAHATKESNEYFQFKSLMTVSRPIGGTLPLEFLECHRASPSALTWRFAISSRIGPA